MSNTQTMNMLQPICVLKYVTMAIKRFINRFRLQFIPHKKAGHNEQRILTVKDFTVNGGDGCTTSHRSMKTFFMSGTGR